MKGVKMDESFYKSVMKDAPFGYACHKIIYDKKGHPCDYVFVDVNESYEKIVGMKEKELIGYRFSNVFPFMTKIDDDWIKIPGAIAAQGGQTELEQYSEVTKKWHRVKVFSTEKDYFIVYIFDGMEKDETLEALTGLPQDAADRTIEIEEDTEMPENEFIWEKRLYEIADVLKLEKDSQFKRIIENLPFSLMILNLNGKILYANPKCLELYEMTPEAIGKKNVKEYWVDLSKRSYWLNNLKGRGIVNDYEMYLRKTSGEEFWAIGNGLIIQYQNEACILSTQIDITEQKKMVSALKASEEKYRLLAEFSSDVIWVLNLTKNRFTYVSPSIYHLAGFSAEEAMQSKLEDALTPESLMMVRDNLERDLENFVKNPERQGPYIREVRQRCKDGSVIWAEVSCKFRRNEAGEVEIVGINRNIEERKKAEREVLYLSYHDQLTGLYNRRFYEEERIRMDFKHNLPITLVIADINGLKLTNDAFGHLSGDELLRKFTRILNKELRAEDVCARIGGDEFILLLPQTTAAEAEELVERIKSSIQNEKSKTTVLSVSFGWATKEKVTDDFNTLFMQAEDGMYHRKLVESINMKNETIRLAMKILYKTNATEQNHSERVSRLCKMIGTAMGLTTSTLWELELLGQMHDIGKVGVSVEILNKVTELNEEEWLEIKRHPEIGYQILRAADEYVNIAEAVLSHHERVDGKGYPRNLKSHEIPLPARILAIAEAYDAMTHPHSFKKIMSEEEAAKELVEHSGQQFDGEIVRIFVENILENKVLNVKHPLDAVT